jgi:hypothetical protein
MPMPHKPVVELAHCPPGLNGVTVLLKIAQASSKLIVGFIE